MALSDFHLLALPRLFMFLDNRPNASAQTASPRAPQDNSSRMDSAASRALGTLRLLVGMGTVLRYMLVRVGRLRLFPRGRSSKLMCVSINPLLWGRALIVLRVA